MGYTGLSALFGTQGIVDRGFLLYIIMYTKLQVLAQNLI